MMTNRHNRKADRMILYTIEELVPADHLVRKLEDAIDWNFIYTSKEELMRQKNFGEVAWYELRNCCWKNGESCIK